MWIREFSFVCEKRNHLAVGEKKTQELFYAGSCLARQHELKGLLSPRQAPLLANTLFWLFSPFSQG